MPSTAPFLLVHRPRRTVSLTAAQNGCNVHVVGGVDELIWRLESQLRSVVPRRARSPLEPIVAAALPRAERCFAHSALPGYRTGDDRLRFDPAQTDQCAMFVWFCSNEAWKYGDIRLAEDLFALNKAMNAIVCMWDTALPEVFLWIHTVGTMLGKADYGERFVAYHNVTVGTDRGASPHLGPGTILFSGAKVVGASTIGERSVVSLNTVVIAETIPADSVVAGRSPDLLVKPRRRWLYGDYFRDEAADPRPTAGRPV